jgi:hypothetical protein
MQLLMVTEAVIRVHTVGKHIVGQGRGSAAACSEDKREKRLHLVLDFFDSPRWPLFSLARDGGGEENTRKPKLRTLLI